MFKVKYFDFLKFGQIIKKKFNKYLQKPSIKELRIKCSLPLTKLSKFLNLNLTNKIISNFTHNHFLVLTGHPNKTCLIKPKLIKWYPCCTPTYHHIPPYPFLWQNHIYLKKKVTIETSNIIWGKEVDKLQSWTFKCPGLFEFQNLTTTLSSLHLYLPFQNSQFTFHISVLHEIHRTSVIRFAASDTTHPPWPPLYIGIVFESPDPLCNSCWMRSPVSIWRNDLKSIVKTLFLWFFECR